MSGAYPTPEEIVSSLSELANTWRLAAVLWHLYFAVFLGAVIFGVRPSTRVAGLLLALPFLSVSVLAFTTFNPVNGVGFAVIGALLLYVAVKIPRGPIQMVSGWRLIAGAFMFAFGWIYPHFLEASSPYSFLYSSPIGVIPCPTLSIGLGLALVLNGLSSRKVPLVLGVAGVVYGLTGFAMLGVTIDVILLFGALVALSLAFAGENRVRRDAE